MASLIKLYKFYRDLNPATLSGAIDVIVVQSKTNELKCTPFHVRFGKLKLLLPQEKTVSMTVNGQPVDMYMKLGDQGEAFFVMDVKSDEVGSDIDSDYWTSPIIPPEDMQHTKVDPLDLEDYVSAVGSEASFTESLHEPLTIQVDKLGLDSQDPVSASGIYFLNDLIQRESVFDAFACE